MDHTTHAHTRWVAPRTRWPILAALCLMSCGPDDSVPPDEAGSTSDALARVSKTPAWTSTMSRPDYPPRWQVSSADMNGDGFDDLVVLDDGVVRRFLGGASGLAATPDWSMSVGRSLGVYVSDFDGDGELDVVTLSDRTGNPRVIHGDAARPSGLSARPVDIAFSEVMGPWLGGDVNGDGLADYLTRGGVILAGVTPTVVWHGQREQLNLTSGDFDDDGYAEVIAHRRAGTGGCWEELEVMISPGGSGGPGTPVRLWHEPCTIHSSTSQTSAQIRAAAAIGDVNADGYADAAFVIEEYRSRCDNPAMYPLTCGATLVGDPRLEVRLGGRHGLASSPVFTDTVAGSATYIAAVGDTNCDGFDEFALRDAGDSTCRLYHGASTASGSIGAVQELTGARRWTCYGAGDVDGSGSADLAVMRWDGTGYKMTVHHGTGYCPADTDGDGSPDPMDCAPADPSIHPGALEIEGDEVDSDCDGGEICFVDADADGTRLTRTLTSIDSDCSDPGEAVAGAPLDCDDTDPSAGFGKPEVWYDGVDQDCLGGSDFDQDEDGQDSDAHGGTDCDDTDPTVGEGRTETWYDGIDQDCLGGSDFDQDGDGVESNAYGGTDCDDLDPLRSPATTEIVGDEIDQDCDGRELCYADADGDGWRVTAPVSSADADCTDPGEATMDVPLTDCDEADPGVYPGAAEIPGDGIDQDCDGADARGGCATTASAPALVLLALPLLVVRRRHPTPARRRSP